MKHRCLAVALTALSWAPAAFAQPGPLIVVKDRGGVSALPYYEALDLPPRTAQALSRIEPPPPSGRVSEADMLPVRSARLSPGEVSRRAIAVPGITPFFLIGDDEHSRAWLRQRASVLRRLGAIGLVVNVASIEALAALRELAPDLMLVPASGDELAERFGLRHYPVLITATGIEQ